ncbi:MAG: DUF1998 domain-containing protein [Planctomycetota bacterium]|nr:DUF1998 domain-containing protein [Planctomycetota bacterium]
MPRPQLRASQLIRSFGPGCMVDLPDYSVIIGGTDKWRYNKSQPLPTIHEPRLVTKLIELTGIADLSLRKPPPAIEDVTGFTPDIAAYRFPEWFIVQKPFKTSLGFTARRLIHMNDLEKGKFRDDDGGKYPVVPVRFVRACPAGHVGDILWRVFVHGEGGSCQRELILEERGTSGDLEGVFVRCACGVERRMSEAARAGVTALGYCDGNRPWLGPYTKDKECSQPSRLLIRNATNAYFSQIMTVISISDSNDAIDEAVSSLWETHLSAVETVEVLTAMLHIPIVKGRLEDFTPEEIMSAIDKRRNGTETDERPVKEVEFEALVKAKEEQGPDVPNGDFYARSLPPAKWNEDWMDSVEKIVLVHRLREVIAQVSFTRFESTGPDIEGELELDVKPAPLGLDVSWLPAVENRGEGIFIQFKADAIQEWLSRPAVKERDSVLQAGFELWHKEHENSKRKYPGLPYFMLHSLSHLLVTTISLECGYPTSSIRERVYALQGKYGILIMTGSPDAEGTLGGLVDEGRRIATHIRTALEMGRLCSNDPVCALHDPQQPDRQPLLGSACHGCVLISETCCEQRNDFLDRALVVPTVMGLGAEFFSI